MLRLAGANTRFNSSYTLSPSSLSLCVCVCVFLLSPPFSLLTPPPLISISLSTYPAASPYFPSLSHFLSHFIPHTIKANNNNKHLFHLCECLRLSVFPSPSPMSLTPVIQPLSSLPFTNPLTTHLFIWFLAFLIT